MTNMEKEALLGKTKPALIEVMEKMAEALEKIQKISAHMDSKRSLDLNRISTQGLSAYKELLNGS